MKKTIYNDRLWLFSSLIAVAIVYLTLMWKTTANIDIMTTNCLFWGAILWLLWQKKDNLNYDSDPISSFVGSILLGIVLSKTITLFSFESSLLPLLPVVAAIAIALLASGIKGLSQYFSELFFAWFLFFPTGVIGHFIDGIIHITIINAKVSTYLLYYFGFNVQSSGNEVILYLPELGNFKAIVDYPCAGVPMILLIVKLALLFISCVSLSKKQQILLPVFSIALGFLLGVIRVCILTIMIPYQTQFNYWHGVQGSQIFSTLAIAIFSGFCYGLLSKKQQSSIA
ncbi:archaeosortase/exosortase family protein [Waterburya agarophytonicola K14]|uniref:Archaeosortase/exosortase family protein n=1 Tax=Waterburya agarophytonicola KI4 TaxID=2874699 RepID=A0A964BQ85_9CYAN|nr:archaeosortase/exosortase family protein [Waterburya agarophytonicola]MCC0176483.1 archaeosortase/exosortase family protein [Waterburya agarophytonicola KI4]